MRAIDGDALQEKLTKKKPGPANARYTEGFNDALLRFKSMIHAAPTIEPEPHWVPCSERLPDGKEYVLVTDYGETNIGRRFCGKWWLDYCGDKMKDVTAWMPLPEPYKEGAKDD